MSFPTPTPDELQRNKEIRAAMRTILESEEIRVFNQIRAEYNSTRTTTEPFVRTSDLKWLRK
jgi:hypothetical protein